MAKNSFRPGLSFQKRKPPAKPDAVAPNPDGAKPDAEPSEAKKKNYYFDNGLVEKLMAVYVKDGCTDVELRDQIMSHAGELIRQIIRTHKLHLIGSGKDGTTFNDLFQIAWVQIESSLYKFNYGPGHTKVFNMWSQVAKTVMLAHIKKESRDRRNYSSYKEHLGHRTRIVNPKFDRFIDEARELCKYSDSHLQILESLKTLFMEDARPHEGLISKLVERSQLPRSKVVSFLKLIRLRSLEFTDSPMSDLPKRPGSRLKGINEPEDEPEV